jgi:hypothetical protein
VIAHPQTRNSQIHRTMKTSFYKIHLAVAAMIFALVGILPTRAHAEPPPDQVSSILRSRVQAEKLPPGETVAMVCAKCKTVILAEIGKNKSFLAWFQPSTKHECPGCGGEFSMKDIPAGQGGKLAVSEYSHTCSKCGDASAFCCAVKAGSSPTKGMEKQ